MNTEKQNAVLDAIHGAMLAMKTENGYARLQFTAYLRHTLIPDFHAADMEATAEDFETSLQFITADTEAMHDARKAMLAASAHLPSGSNAAALVSASLRELDAILGYPAPTKQETPCQSRRCMEDRCNLTDK